MFRSKELTTSNGKFIHVYDGLFSQAEMEFFYKFVTSSFFKWGGFSGPLAEAKDQIYAAFSLEDVENMGFKKSDGFKFLEEKYKIPANPRPTDRAKVNLSCPFEDNTIHTDGRDGFTMLYYVNLKWELGWNGHTLFMDDNVEEPEHLVLYKPGRLVAFDASIPHMVMTQMPRHRFCFVLQYEPI